MGTQGQLDDRWSLDGFKKFKSEYGKGDEEFILSIFSGHFERMFNKKLGIEE